MQEYLLRYIKYVGCETAFFYLVALKSKKYRSVSFRINIFFLFYKIESKY